MIRVRSPQDMGAGVLFISIGAIGLWLADELSYGSAQAMGPGFFPTWISACIVGLGLITAARSLVLTGPPLGDLRLRPLALVLLAVLACGFLIEHIGLAISLLVLTAIAGLSRADTNWRQLLLIAVGLSIVCVVVFVHLLGQSLPGWWGR